MPPDSPNDTLSELQHRTLHDALGCRIVDIHIRGVREGLRGADAYELFDGYCQRLVVRGTPFVARTLCSGAVSPPASFW
jgi:hypothetical protein